MADVSEATERAERAIKENRAIRTKVSQRALQLVAAADDAAFDCGEYQSDGSELVEYDAVHASSEEAQTALFQYIADLEAKAGQVPSSA